MQLDVPEEASIKAAEQHNHGKLDVLIKSARIGVSEASGPSNLEESYAENYNTNLIGVAFIVTTIVLLMKETSSDPRIINISSAPALLRLSFTGNLAPSRVISYSVSKTARIVLTVEDAKAEPVVSFYAANSGHCKTAFNWLQGYKKPVGLREGSWGIWRWRRRGNMKMGFGSGC